MAESTADHNPCPSCGHGRATLEARCGECGWKPKPSRTPMLVRANVTLGALVDAARTVSIGSLFLITALVAVCAAVLAKQPILGVVLSLVSAIALARTALFVTYSKADGDRLTAWAKLIAFVQSALLVLVTAVSTAIAFVAVCVPTTVFARNLWIGEFAGFLVAVIGCIVILLRVPVYRQDS